MKYADVIIDIRHEKVDRSFQYRIPEELVDAVKVGSPVSVPFGRGSRARQGYVIGISEEPQIEDARIKSLLGVDEKRIPVEPQLIMLAGWMRRQYGGTFTQCLSTVLPVKRRTKRRASAGEPDTTAQAAGEGTSPDEGEALPPLNEYQKKALEVFAADYRQQETAAYLLWGVTGSGKTRVYLEMMELVVAAGRQVIVLIPEIALTQQNIRRFSARFGEKVAVLHSRLSGGERYEVYEKARQGEVRIVLGPRSALFVPFVDIGLIIVDEEHETSYKSEQMPKYHAREAALERARLAGASVVFGSATPSLESIYRVRTHQYKLLSLPKRVGTRRLPASTVVDMRRELRSGNTTILSGVLREKMDAALAQGEQIILFLNRRGVAGFVSCRACGSVEKCPHCDVSLHQHRDGRLKCHYCGYEKVMPDTCPSCGSPHYGGIRIGTQGVERLVQEQWKDARILRMDADTTRHKGDHERILTRFAEGEADILLGTQMIVKGHDFPGVSLVGILAADMSLNSSDFGGGERTFDLLVQAAGRAGRGDIPGEVVIQTYQPEHYAIQTAARADLKGFIKKELAYRRLMGYPPTAHMLLVQITSSDAEEGIEAAREIRGVIAQGEGRIFVAEPTEAVIARIKDRYRFAVYVKAPEYEALTEVKDRIEQHVLEEAFAERYGQVRVFFDFDPLGVF